MQRFKKLLAAPTTPSFLTGAILLAMVASQAMADTLLTVSGDVSATDAGLTWQFEESDLRALPKVQFETDTIWTEGTQVFEGVSLSALLTHVGASDGNLLATAANDYTVSIPTSDAVENGPIIAYLRNGEKMTLRDKGPLWIVYPFAGNDAYKTEEYYSRSIWQLDRIEVVANE
ncbi:molybdopterin-dependent oxidoreductase [Shimia sp.]|uniref:molybdopterin-dependent oxidoreductase n=1 Tax=unclassified Shimia TaxID=2630038 RepID=UPI0025CE146D|nr:molybdopterin-dependent oxidoreductase [Shimia sp.]MCH2069116.1 molybdopterin-dependent oxidoreductase [Shimia sp.]